MCSLSQKMKGVFNMNTKENQEKWDKKCEKILKLGGKSDLTIVNYRCGWNKLFNHYSEETILSKLNEEKLIDYFKEEYIDKGYSGSYYNEHLCAIRLLYSVCFKKELNRTLLPSHKLKKGYPIFITKEEFLRIVNLEKDIEHKFWLVLSFCSGLRAIDIAQLRIEYFYSEEHKLKVLGKGNKERFTILPDAVIKIGRLYCKNKNIHYKTGYLFKGLAGRDHINPRTISNYFGEIKKKFVINKEITEHSLRHGFATYYLMNDGNLLTLKEMLGHSSLQSTCIYVHMAHDFNHLKGINYDRNRK